MSHCFFKMGISNLKEKDTFISHDIRELLFMSLKASVSISGGRKRLATSTMAIGTAVRGEICLYYKVSMVVD